MQLKGRNKLGESWSRIFSWCGLEINWMLAVPIKDQGTSTPGANVP